MRSHPESDQVKQFFSMFMATTDELVAKDTAALLAHLATDTAARTGSMGCIGYCIGARSVLRAVGAHPEVFTAAVGQHPSFCVTADTNSPHLVVWASATAFYFGLGEADGLQTVESCQPLIDALRDHGDEVDIFPGADHGFAVPGFSYDPVASNKVYSSAIALFHARLTPA